VRLDLGHFLRNLLWVAGRYYGAWPLGRLLFDFQSRGAEYIPLRGGVLVASNHVSYFDPPILGLAQLRVVNYMARAELFANPVFAALIRAWGAFPIRRDMWSAGGLKAARCKLDEGKLVVFFPEGTRAHPGRMGPAMPGAGLLVHQARYPVIPAFIVGTDKVMPRGAKRPRLAPVRVRFGPALALDDLRALPACRETYQAIADRVMAAVAALRDDGGGE